MSKKRKAVRCTVLAMDDKPSIEEMWAFDGLHWIAKQNGYFLTTPPHGSQQLTLQKPYTNKSEEEWELDCIKQQQQHAAFEQDQQMNNCRSFCNMYTIVNKFA